MSEPVIEVRHLSKSFGTHVVLRDVDFTVNAGDVTCIIRRVRQRQIHAAALHQSVGDAHERQGAVPRQ